MTRRVTTAREQDEMLSPWRTADARWIEKDDKGGRVRYPPRTQGLIDGVRSATGINLDVENTGGNNYVLSGRLEDGSWVVATDGGSGDTWWDTADRHRHEAEHGPLGWDIGFYHNQTDGHGDFWGFDPVAGHSVEPFHWHADEDSTADELPAVMGRALATMPHGAKLDPVEPGLTTSPPKPAGSTSRNIDYGGLANPGDDIDDDYGDFGGLLGGKP